MTPDEIRRLFPNASSSLLQANLDLADTGATPKPKRAPSDAAMGKAQVQAGVGPRFFIRVTSIRKRLLDEDNLVPKYHIDLLRYAGVVPDDAPGTCKIETRQRKAAKGEVEETIIEVMELTGEQP